MAEKSSHSRAKSALGGHGHSKGKAHSMHIKRGKSGGFVATHHHEPDEMGMTPPSEDHVVPDLAALHAHMDDQMGDQPPAPQAPDPTQAAAAPAGAQPGM